MFSNFRFLQILKFKFRFKILKAKALLSDVLQRRMRRRGRGERGEWEDKEECRRRRRRQSRRRRIKQRRRRRRRYVSSWRQTFVLQVGEVGRIGGKRKARLKRLFGVSGWAMIVQKCEMEPSSTSSIPPLKTKYCRLDYFSLPDTCFRCFLYLFSSSFFYACWNRLWTWNHCQGVFKLGTSQVWRSKLSAD